MSETRDASRAQTLDRGIRILEVLADAGRPLSMAELVDALGVHRTIAHRLLNTLADHHLVVRHDSAYGLGSGLLGLARNVQGEFRALARAELAAVAEALKHTVVLTIVEDGEAVAFMTSEPRHVNMHLSYRPGLRHPIGTGASGKALMIGEPVRDDDPGWLVDARRQGYVRSFGELQPGIEGVAVPVPDRHDRPRASIAAVALGQIDVDDVLPRLREAASNLAGPDVPSF